MTQRTMLTACLVIAGAAGIGGTAYFAQRASTLRTSVRELDAANQKTRDDRSAMENDLSEAADRLAEMQQENESLQTRLNEVVKERDRLQNNLRTTEGELAEASNKLSKVANVMNAANGELTQTRRENERLKAQLKDYTAELESKQNKLQRTNETQQQLVGELKREIARRQIKITQLGDSLSVRMIGNILFPTGKAELTPEGIEVLQRVGDIIGKVEDKTIRVEGHTDDRPISYALRQTYPSNWELSTARATNVVHFLVDRIGIPANRLEAVGRAEHDPIAANDTPEGRSKNRRIEILLVPPREEVVTLAAIATDTPAAEDNE